MRIIEKRANFFDATHKGAEIQIDQEPCGRFYIIVIWKDGGHLYDGYAPPEVTTWAQAKAEAVRGACLDQT